MSKIYSINCNSCKKDHLDNGEYVCNNDCPYTKESLLKFWSNIDNSDLFSCWNWTYSKDCKGYGRLCIDGKTIKAHRYSYILNVGYIPDGLFVCHKCNNPACVNPYHLYLGTAQDNMNDKVNACRQTHLLGEKNHFAKLTEIQVKEIIELLKTNLSNTEIGKRYSVTGSIVGLIKRNRIWKHIPR